MKKITNISKFKTEVNINSEKKYIKPGEFILIEDNVEILTNFLEHFKVEPYVEKINPTKKENKDLPDINKMSYNNLLHLAKELGLNVKKPKKEELIKLLKEHYNGKN